MVTYGNGDYISRMLYEGINTCYEDKTMRYYSYCAATGKESEDYMQKDVEFLVRYPPLGETIRQLYDDGASSEWQPWMVSDNERNTREIQGVRCQHMFAHDHTHQVVKNYPRRLNAAAMWTMATEAGEIACAVLVHDTSALEFAHAAEQVLRRTGFCPKAMYSDTWPCGKDFWLLLVDDLEGRLGLFHFIQRITKTLRQRHIDFGIAMKDLLDAIYEYHPEDLEKLVGCLKNGTMSSSKKQYTDEEISEMMGTKTFRQRYSKNLRKIIRGGDTIVLKLEEWKCKYKCTSTPGKPPARGRLDPHSNQPLFTAETHQALENCKEKAKFLADPLPVEKMYRERLRAASRAPKTHTPYAPSAFFVPGFFIRIYTILTNPPHHHAHTTSYTFTATLASTHAHSHLPRTENLPSKQTDLALHVQNTLNTKYQPHQNKASIHPLHRCNNTRANPQSLLSHSPMTPAEATHLLHPMLRKHQRKPHTISIPCSESTGRSHPPFASQAPKAPAEATHLLHLRLQKHQQKPHTYGNSFHNTIDTIHRRM